MGKTIDRQDITNNDKEEYSFEPNRPKQSTTTKSGRKTAVVEQFTANTISSTNATSVMSVPFVKTQVPNAFVSIFETMQKYNLILQPTDQHYNLWDVLIHCADINTHPVKFLKEFSNGLYSIQKFDGINHYPTDLDVNIEVNILFNMTKSLRAAITKLDVTTYRLMANMKEDSTAKLKQDVKDVSTVIKQNTEYDDLRWDQCPANKDKLHTEFLRRVRLANGVKSRLRKVDEWRLKSHKALKLNSSSTQWSVSKANGFEIYRDKR